MRVVMALALIVACAGAGTRAPLNALPSREDMGKAMDYAEDFMRRMMRLLREDERAPRERI